MSAQDTAKRPAVAGMVMLLVLFIGGAQPQAVGLIPGNDGGGGDGGVFFLAARKRRWLS